MCLANVTNKKPVIAKKDISCFKVLRIIDYNIYQTPYQNELVTLGETYSSVLAKPDRDNEIYIGLHSFLTLKQTKVELKSWSKSTYIIVKCVVPIGANYYRGTYLEEFGKTAIASDTLKYISILNK